MWLLLGEIVVIITFLYLIKKKNYVINKVTVFFNVVWFVISIIAVIGIDNELLKNIDRNYILFIIFIFVYFMNLGFFLFFPSEPNNLILNKEGESTDNNIIENSLERILEKRITLLILFVLALLLFTLRESIQYVLSGNLDAIRNSIYYTQVGSADSLFSSGIETILVQWVLNGLILAVNIVVISAYMKKKCNLRVVLLSIFTGLVFSILTGGRIMILKIFFIIFINIFIVSSDNFIKYSKKNAQIVLKRKINPLLIVIVGLFLLVVIITFARNVDENSFEFTNIINVMSSYLSSPIVYFSVLLDNIINESDYLYGGAFFGGITQLVDIFLKNIVNYDRVFPFQQLTNETSVFLSLGNGVYYNAFPTMLYYFLRDLGFIGVIVCSLLYTYIISVSYKKNKSNSNLRNLSIYVLSIYILAMGILNWAPALATFWITLFFVYVLSNNFFVVRN